MLPDPRLIRRHMVAARTGTPVVAAPAQVPAAAPAQVPAAAPAQVPVVAPPQMPVAAPAQMPVATPTHPPRCYGAGAASAVTMGNLTILNAEAVVLLACGEGKAAMIDGQLAVCPAPALQWDRKATIARLQAAASRQKPRDDSNEVRSGGRDTAI